MKTAIRRFVAVSGLLAFSGLAVLWQAGVAHAGLQHLDPQHSSGASISSQEILVGVSHGAVQSAAAFLVGLVAFVALVWLPVGRAAGTNYDSGGLFVRWVWTMFGLLVVAGVVELSLYAVRASGEPFGLGLLGQAVFETRVGSIWLVRLALALLTAGVVTFAVRWGRPAYWWAALGIGSVLLATLTQLSHAAAEQRLLPFLSDWVHVCAAAVWMGGLLAFPIVLVGPIRAMPEDQRAKMRRQTVRRFSRAATVAVMTLIVTGAHAILLHVPDVPALIGTPYGRALIMKLGLLVFLLAAGGMNLRLQGKEPFDRMVGGELILAIGIFVATGFLTSLPPPGP